MTISHVFWTDSLHKRKKSNQIRKKYNKIYTMPLNIIKTTLHKAGRTKISAIQCDNL